MSLEQLPAGPTPAGDNNIGNVDVASSVLPTGAATEATLGTVATEIGATNDILAGGLPADLGAGGGLKVDGSGTPVPVSVATALPEGFNYIGLVGTELQSGVLDDASTISLQGNYLSFGDYNGRQTVALEIAGTWDGEVEFQGGAGDTGSWAAISVINLATGALVQSTVANGVFLVAANGLNRVRALVSTLNSGTVEFHSGQVFDPTLVRLSASLPAGTNNIGDVDVVSSALPTGAATETTQAAANVLLGAVNETAPATDTASSGTNGRLQRIAQRLTSLIALLPAALGAGGGLKVDGSGTALPVSGTVAVTGVATETTLAAQSVLVGAVTETAPATDTASSGLNGRLQRIAQRLSSAVTLLAGGLPAALGAGGGVKVDGSGTALPVTASAGTNLNTSALALEATQTAQATLIGAVTETAPVTDTASSGLNGRLQRVSQRITSLIALLPSALGQGTMAQSLRVVLPSDQAAIPVTASAGTNLNTSALALEATQTAQATLIGAVTETAPATDTASSGLNGRLQRIAQRITSLIALVPAALGQGTMAQSFRVVVASDQSALTVASHAVTNAGVFATQVDGSALTALQLIDDPVIADDAAFTPGTSKVSMAGFQADETSTDSVDEGDAGAARMTLDRKVIVTPQPHAAGGLSIFRSIDLDEGTLEVVKNSAGCVYGMWVTNTATTTRWVKFYDATSGTLGTGTPVITIGIPGNTSDDIAGNFGPGGMGILFATGICVGAGTGVADNDTGAPGTNDVIINVFYK